MPMNTQVRPTSSLGSSALPYVNEFIRLLGLPLLVVPYSIASSALTDGLWGLIYGFFFFFRKKKWVFMEDSSSSHY